ncbi:hypothetical protein N5079_33785 [Planotetraspora sp. A-T 1434]|uniref:hypothetical protein n=1 Tax=Planotetraspora sp. A-T 1434 TaxID=2979219 RepID=UPI0021C0EE6C|nr:hypothetical protein [Planotetraspora sp. A-T 1434]MCT9935184.1 hypothetical protein [Planotetraspora sp. A-T 1434]
MRYKAAALALLLSLGACAADPPSAAHRAVPTPSAVRPVLCRATEVRCADVLVPEAAGRISYAVVPGTKPGRGLILVEMGGPGVRALQQPDRDSLGLPPALAADDVLLISEPWVDRPVPAGCGAALREFGMGVSRNRPAPGSLLSRCSPATWTRASYVAALDGILRHEGRSLTGIVGQSFGALPANAAAVTHPGAWLILNAPVAPATTPGTAVLGERVAALHAALDRSYARACVRLGLDCGDSGARMVGAAVRRASGTAAGTAAGDIGLAALGSSYDLRTNERWLWSTLSRFPALDEGTGLQLGRMADQILQRYGGREIALDMAAFVAGTCLSYGGWDPQARVPDGAPETLLVHVADQCEGRRAAASGWDTGTTPIRRGATCVLGNALDPVTPGVWAARWRKVLSRSTFTAYRFDGHASLATAAKLAGRSACGPLAPAIP